MVFTLFHLYLVCLVLGVGYAVLMALMGSIGGDHGGHSGDAGHAGCGHDGGGDLSAHGDAGHTDGSTGHDSGSGLSPFSPLMLATFATLFGGLGFISLGLFKIVPVIPEAIRDVVSLLVSGSLAMVMASYFSFFLVRLFVKTETSSNISTSRLIGREAEASMDIDLEKMGEITYLHGGSRQNNMARLAEGCLAIKKGQQVEIVAIVDNVMMVKPLENPGPTVSG